MSNSLNLKDINALIDLGKSLREFKQGICQRLYEIHIQINKESEWIQNNVINCQREVERSHQQVERAKLDVFRCQQSGSRDRNGQYQPPNCYREEATLAKAEADLREKKTKLQIAQKWRSQIEQQVTDFRKEERRLSQLATEETSKALQDLGRLITGYQAVADSASNLSSGFSRVYPIPNDYIPEDFDYENTNQKQKEKEGKHDTLFEKAKKEFKKRSLYDPEVSDYIKGWLRQEIRRVDWNGNWRNPPGFQVGHIIPGIDRPENLRWENADMNQSRGGKTDKKRKELINQKNCVGRMPNEPITWYKIRQNTVKKNEK